MKIQSHLKRLSALLIVLMGVATGAGVYAAMNDRLLPQSKAVTNSHFPRNASGETYGSARNVAPNEKTPDLVKVEGINGKIGYARLTDLNGEEPKTIEEALAQQSKKEVRVINVYESDGKKIIDKFEIKPDEDNQNK